MNLIIVIPDGLLTRGNIIPTISKTYKATLDLAISHSKSKSKDVKFILLPANSFGTDKFEQDYGMDYLIKKNINPKNIYKGISDTKKYIDTKGNFLLGLKNGFFNKFNKEINIKKNITFGKYTLASSHLHIDRTLFIIKTFNWKAPKKVIISYAQENKRISYRLIHYRFPSLRMFYEMIAINIIKIEKLFMNFYYLDKIKTANKTKINPNN